MGHTTRIVSGLWKGRVIVLPESADVRPSKTMVRQAVFNLVLARTDLAGRTVLDLCTGSGALALEAASRGAAAVTGVDREIAAAERNRQALGSPAQVTFVQGDVRHWSPLAAADIVLVDAPYAGGLTAAVLARRNVFGQAGSIWVVETAAEEELCPAGFSPLADKTYGRSRLRVLRQD